MSRKASAAVAPIGVPASAARVAHAFGQRLEVVDLAGVGAERLELAVQRRGHVDPDVGVVRPEEVQPPDPVRREAAACEPRERHRVARRRVRRVDRRHARGAVVGVVHAVGAMEDRLGVGREDGVRTEGADLADEVLAEGQVVGQRTVGSVQERDPGVADHVGRGPLLRLADRRELERVEVRVLAALVAARAAHEPGLGAFRDPAGTRRGRPEVGVVRVARDDHEAGRAPAVVAVRPVIDHVSARSQRMLRKVAAACRRSVLLPPRLRSSPPTSEASVVSCGQLRAARFSAREPSGARRGRRARRRHDPRA